MWPDAVAGGARRGESRRSTAPDAGATALKVPMRQWALQPQSLSRPRLCSHDLTPGMPLVWKVLLSGGKIFPPKKRLPKTLGADPGVLMRARHSRTR